MKEQTVFVCESEYSITVNRWQPLVTVDNR
jgi:hypothetical protein